ncbi:TIGR01906 family membrane protein [Clostridium sp. CX1]|uniref:TIGR01906 family membrane protein n=1 Tax=Clostridium sp. CX1 TaxID=2978346 RepID=UPI0021BFCF9C|nr:TIGR01906 family membrane protein [Clostridium sp. CX1]MCT8976322.1 TIGR01906 family membrane protein [Clostridium sp. CX1]
MKTIARLLLTFSLLLFITASSVKIALNFKALYYWDIEHLNIKSYTTLSKEEIRSTYDYLINFINTDKTDEFRIPLLPSSKEAAIHFQEVKSLFIKLNYILFSSAIVSAAGIYYMKKYRDFSPLKWCSIMIWLSFIVLSGTFYINFDKSFNFFHKVLFNNDYWLFSPKTDPVINILPQEFFLHCAILILLLIVLWSAFLLIIFRKLNKDKRVSI